LQKLPRFHRRGPIGVRRSVSNACTQILHSPPKRLDKCITQLWKAVNDDANGHSRRVDAHANYTAFRRSLTPNILNLVKKSLRFTPSFKRSLNFRAQLSPSRLNAVQTKAIVHAPRYNHSPHNAKIQKKVQKGFTRQKQPGELNMSTRLPRPRKSRN